ncbi:MAG: nitroreductase family protein [Myxococcota bacterium]
MDVREAILTRKTVQKYSEESIPEGCIDRALECAIRAPNHKLTNPWRFSRVGPQTREQIVALGIELKAQKAARRGRELTESYVDELRAKLGNSPGLLIVSQVLADDAFRRKEDYASVACAIQNISLSLWSEGVGSKWATGGVTRHPETYAIAGIDPDEEEIVGFVWIGHPSQGPTETPREPAEDVTRELP